MSAPRDIAWSAVWLGYALALAGTLAAAGWGLVVAGKGMWWVTNWGALLLFIGAAAAGFAARTPEPLNGAYIAVLYFGSVTLVVFAGEFLGVLPDPLPGLPRGDSTFYFVWPLEQLAAATLGAMAGGWLRRRAKPPWTEEAEQRLARVPEAMRPMVRAAIEHYARQQGYREIDFAVVDEAKAKMHG